ncbi:MAG TPA: metallophosphoesterase [Polyangiaceae bacterium]|nr:metallophosphoesterase [Polyangiaceae bacterium]
MRFALISDVHLGPQASHQGKLRKLTHQSEELVMGFVRRMRDEVNPDLIINLGDVIEDESAEKDRERYGHFVSMLREIGKPVLHVAGNHDTINLTCEELCTLWGTESNVMYSRDVEGVHFAVLRTIEHRGERIELPAEQIAWLRDDLAKATLPCVVLMHHPASEMRLEGNRWFEKRPNLCRVVERRAVREVIEKSGKVLAVFNGHVHWNHFDVIAGIPYITLQSLIENLDDDAPGRAAAAYAVCELDERRLVVNVGGAEAVRYQVERTRPADQSGPDHQRTRPGIVYESGPDPG